MSVKLFRVILPVTGVDKAAAFYGRILNMPGHRVSEGRHYFDCGGTILACFDPHADGDGYHPTPNPELIYFAVDDIAATYEACKQTGATFSAGDVHGSAAGEINTRPWGERSFYIHDPFGNPICFVDRATVFTGQGAR